MINPVRRKVPSLIAPFVILTVIICLLALSIGVAFQRRQAVARLHEALAIWNVELSRALISNDWLTVNKIGQSLPINSFDSISISKDSNLIFNYPANSASDEVCNGIEQFDVARYGIILAKVRVCAGLQKILLEPFKSPIFIAFGIGLVGLLCLLILTPAMHYQKQVLNLLNDLTAWSRGDSSSEIDLSPNAADAFRKIHDSIRDGVNHRIAAEKLRAESLVSKRLANLAAQVAHDIRSPLGAIEAAVHALRDVPEDHRVLLKKAVQRINSIANDLLSERKSNSFDDKLSISDHAIDPLEVSQISMPDLLDSIFSEKKFSFQHLKNLDLKLDLPTDSPSFCDVNEKEISRALSNLLNNAIESLIDDRGKVTLALRNASETVSIHIVDNGRGIEAQTLAQLGSRPWRSQKESSQSGNGLGVYHARSTIERMRGRFTIQSNPGNGTMVSIHFPKANRTL